MAKGRGLVRTCKLSVHWAFYCCEFSGFELYFASAVLPCSVSSAKFAVPKVAGLEKQSLPKQNWVRLGEKEDYLDLRVI